MGLRSHALPCLVNLAHNHYTYTPLASCIQQSFYTFIPVHTLIQHIRLSAWIHWLLHVSTGICVSCPQSSWGIHDLTLAQRLIWTPGEKGREGVNLTRGLWRGHRLKRHPLASNGSKTGSMCDMRVQAVSTEQDQVLKWIRLGPSTSAGMQRLRVKLKPGISCLFRCFFKYQNIYVRRNNYLRMNLFVMQLKDWNSKNKAETHRTITVSYTISKKLKKPWRVLKKTYLILFFAC